MPTDFAAARKQAEKEGYIGSDYLKVKEGANRIRLLSEALPHRGSYKGTPNFKWLCYVLDRTDGNVKPYFMPHTIYKAIEALQTSEDYAFDDVPMPYDITINAQGAGTKEVEYSVMPAKKETPLTAEERNQYETKKPLKELQQAIRAKDEDKQPERSNGFDPDDDNMAPV
jgi:hypothetical protein